MRLTLLDVKAILLCEHWSGEVKVSGCHGKRCHAVQLCSEISGLAQEWAESLQAAQKGVTNSHLLLSERVSLLMLVHRQQSAAQ